jgi:hypothetical protein
VLLIGEMIYQLSGRKNTKKKKRKKQPKRKKVVKPTRHKNKSFTPFTPIK